MDLSRAGLEPRTDFKTSRRNPFEDYSFTFAYCRFASRAGIHGFTLTGRHSIITADVTLALSNSRFASGIWIRGFTLSGKHSAAADVTFTLSSPRVFTEHYPDFRREPESKSLASPYQEASLPSWAPNSC